MGVRIRGLSGSGTERLEIDGNANGTRQPVDVLVSEIRGITSHPKFEKGRIGTYEVSIKTTRKVIKRRLNHFDFSSVIRLLNDCRIHALCGLREDG